MDDCHDTFPLTSESGQNRAWLVALEPYSRTRLIYRCPSDESRNFETPLPGQKSLRLTSYGVNNYFSPLRRGETSSDTHGFTKMSRVQSPSSTIYSAEVATDAISDHIHPAHWVFPNSEMTYIDPFEEVNPKAHRNVSNYLFVDGHVEALPFERTWDTTREMNLWDPL